MSLGQAVGTDPVSIATFAQQLAVSASGKRAARLEDRSRAYMLCEQDFLRTWTQLQWLQARSKLYSHPILGLPLASHLMRNVDEVQSRLTELLVALTTLELLACPAPVVAAAKNVLEGLNQLAQVMRQPSLWRPARRQQNQRGWEAAQTRVIELREVIKKAVQTDLKLKRRRCWQRAAGDR